MKKVVAVLLALTLMLTMAFAVAEESTVSTYMMVAAADAEGNVVDIETAELPVLVLAIDGATGECAFGTEGNTVEGTYEMVASDDDEGVYVLTATLNDGSSVVMFYSVEDDMFWVISEDGVSMFLYNLETLVAAADAA